ncbi:MAG: T9SS type A sorting domain-containing protein, partial [Ignavibacteriae bacterium]|nr:T9SS type A sorting domain-containing protein [Ignavibacteriota bacterium]
ILFDNGNYHSHAFSRAIEYKIDEDVKSVELTWEYRHSPDIYAYAMGSVQRLSNGNTLIGWGSAPTTLTEVTPNGTIAYELSLPAGQMSYRAFRDEWGTMTGRQPTVDVTPSKFALYQNYPNPFNPSTNIKYQLAKNSNVTLKIYDILGKEIATLVNEFQRAGTYEKQFSINQYSGIVISSGIYFCKLQTEDFADIKKMLMIK